ncbi:EAL domain-containing protein [Trinickia terrae]|uniref:EAL domain-containing protein n=1 Tax=Trinickia terrae TaxID=2571161 RepID=A0A4U1I3X9_9BURK|nr:EAL domain-containing protein [Trinickia terrae]TKC87964.1 EAL domain-containing protein [Trinickia terrae]
MNWARQFLIPVLVLSAGLGLTWIVWDHERRAAQQELLTQFDFALGDAVSRVDQRMATYQMMLRGAQSLFATTTGTVDRERFRDYVNTLSQDPTFAGVQAIGIVKWVPAAQKAAHIAAMHSEGLTEYTIHPDGEREDYAPIIQREAYVGRNRPRLGFDAWADPVRRHALEKSRDSGMPTITGKLRLAVDTEAEAHPGFVMYLPIYARGQSQNDIAARRAHLVGWVYASFHMRDIIASLYGDEPPGLTLAMYDGVEPSEATLMHRSSGSAGHHQLPALSANEYLYVAGHDWTLSLVAQDDFKARFGRHAQMVIATAGAGLSLLLALLAWLIVTGRSRAMRLASAMTRELREHEAELRIAAVAFNSLEAMMITDACGKILRVNSAFTECTGYTPAEIVGETPRILNSGRHDAAFFREMWDTIHRVGGWQGEIWDRRKNGDIYPKWLTIAAVTGEDGVVSHYVGTHHDITESKIAEERIKELAFFDALTRLPNRTLLMDRLKQAITASARNDACGALLFIDLDHFKTLNDTLGHDKGDLLLRQVAQRLAASVQENDTVARVGGDEFVVVLGSLSENRPEAASQTEALGERIIAVLGEPYQLAELEYRATASIGATVFKGHQASIDELLKQADLAMYKSKERGRNAMCFFDPNMQIAVLERAVLEAGLRHAIAEDQFLLHYQAQIDGDRVTGVEALVRWQHPQRGIVPPSDFIPLAEETGLILELGYRVLETACAQLARWAARPGMAHLTIAVNVSAQQLREPGFVDKVLNVIGQTGARPDRLKLELTESVLVDNVQDIIGKMSALKERGVVFSLDDFGIGYSSLSYLKLLPLDQLKIDRSFVRDVLVDPNDAAIARTIVTLARSLGLGVIAEGVETEAQRDFLAMAGCHAYQGYYFCRPLPIDGFEAFANRYLESA